MLDTVPQLLMLMGIALAQSVGDVQHYQPELAGPFHPAAVILVNGQSHTLSFRDQPTDEATQSVAAALSMHGRYADMQAQIQPSKPSSPWTSVVLNGSSVKGKLQISLTIALDQTKHNASFSVKELQLNSTTTTATEAAHLLDFLRKGYRTGQSAPLPIYYVPRGI